MGVSAEDVEVLERVVIGLPRVAEALVPLAPDDKERALAAVEGAYQKRQLNSATASPKRRAGLQISCWVCEPRFEKRERFNLVCKSLGEGCLWFQARATLEK
jgi:hypothetical protein